MSANRVRYLLLAMSLAINDGLAAVCCLDVSVELQQAFQTADIHNRTDTFYIEAGVHVDSGGLAFDYSTNRHFSLTVSGGARSGRGLLLDPALSVLTGSGNRAMQQMLDAGGTISAISLTNPSFRNGFSTHSGTGALIGGGADDTGNVSVTRVPVESIIGTAIESGMVASAGSGLVNVLNNQFLGNRCGNAGCALGTMVDAASGSTYRASFGNHTVVFNRCDAANDCSASGARFGGSARALLHHNVSAGNTNGDVALQSAGHGSVDVYHNNRVPCTGSAPASMSGNIGFADPEFVRVHDDDFRPTSSSPLRNAGTDSFTLLTFDLNGSSRSNDGIVGIRAYRSRSFHFADQFEVLMRDSPEQVRPGRCTAFFANGLHDLLLRA